MRAKSSSVITFARLARSRCGAPAAPIAHASSATRDSVSAEWTRAGIRTRAEKWRWTPSRLLDTFSRLTRHARRPFDHSQVK
eukprot:scaffold13448_cov109-Isochrysis_galbana.AAC.6